jgi:hypothetical protein
LRITHGTPGESTLDLPAGEWSISLQYVATQGIRLTAAGLDSKLPANLDFRGPSSFWPAGEITVTKPERVRFTLSVEQSTLFGRLIGAESLAFPLQIAATPVGPHQEVPMRKACGRYVDFITPG